jgi:hypothetical protein
MSRTLVALTLPVVGSMAVSIAGLWLSRQVLPAKVLEHTNDVVGNYLQTLGSIYAVLLAFVVFVVWNQFNEARAFVDTESNELLDLYRTVPGLAEPTRGRVRALVRQYVQVVIDSEWESMACAGPRGVGAGAPILDQMWQAVHGAEPKEEPDRSLYREVLKRLDDVSDARSSRLNASRTKIPQALRVLLYAGAVTLVLSMYLFAVDSFAVHAAITAALAGAISHILFIVEDLDNCFHGHWQVPKTPFERVREQVSEEAEDA